MVLEIKIYGEESLRIKSEEVKEIDSEIIEILNNMVETMEEIKGVGLAAPQIGINKRMFVLNIGDGIIRKVINPKIEYSKETVECEEGCLSIPGIYRNVKRAETVKVEYTNEKNEKIVEEATELLARAFQHENDHLDGVLFTDKVSPVAKRLIRKKLQAMTKKVKG
ncbi:MAG: peptide deformylase [Fusobacteriaceae bacterium]